jgi:hypothetical protein
MHETPSEFCSTCLTRIKPANRTTDTTNLFDERGWYRRVTLTCPKCKKEWHEQAYMAVGGRALPTNPFTFG